MELETLIRLTRKTAGYLNLALEEMTKKNREHAREILRDRALVSIFRVGFGYVNRLKKDAEIWHENSWYRRHGFNHDFWGDERGSLLAGLFLKKPQLYTGLKNGEFYRDFSSADDLAKARKTLSGLISLDRLMEILTSTYPLPERVTEREDLICSQLIFTLWGRYILGLDVGFVPLPPAEARRLFATLRKGEKRPPYRMETYKSVFLDTMCAHPDLKTVDLYASLAEILLQLWEEFKEEYKDVPLKHTDMRYSPFLLIE